MLVTVGKSVELTTLKLRRFWVIIGM